MCVCVYVCKSFIYIKHIYMPESKHLPIYIFCSLFLNIYIYMYILLYKESHSCLLFYFFNLFCFGHTGWHVGS